MSTVQTPNMSLYVPTLGVDSGVTWETQVNANSQIIDGHNHSIGSGVQINVSGVNFTGDLPLNGNNIVLLRSTRYVSQVVPLSGAADLLCCYFSGVDFYVNDGNGNQIQITTGGNVNATSSGISDGTATASFVSSVLVVDSAPNTPANIQGASILLGNTGVAGSNYLTLSPPSSLAASYGIIFPALPTAASNEVLTLSSSGVMGTFTFDEVAESFTVLGANAIGETMNATGANAIAASMTSSGVEDIITTMGSTGANNILANIAAVPPASSSNLIRQGMTMTTGQTVGLGGFAVGPSCGSFTTSDTSFTGVTNLTVTLTTSGRPILIGLESSGFSSNWFCSGSSGNNVFLGAFVDSNLLFQYSISIDAPQAAPAILGVALLSSGTHTVVVQMKVSVGTAFGEIQNYQLFAYELS